MKGFFIELLKLHSHDNETLRSQLKRRQDYTTPTIPNEIISLMSHEVFHAIVKEINCSSQYHSVIVDGTLDYLAEAQSVERLVFLVLTQEPGFAVHTLYSIRS